MKSGNVVLGVLAGLAAGALMGILFAPEKGSKTRKQIMRKGDDYADELKEKFDDIIDSVSEKYESLIQESKDAVSNGQMKFDETKKELKKAVS